MPTINKHRLTPVCFPKNELLTLEHYLQKLGLHENYYMHKKSHNPYKLQLGENADV